MDMTDQTLLKQGDGHSGHAPDYSSGQGIDEDHGKSSTEQLERFETWLILHHFMLVSQSFVPGQRDCMMVWTADYLSRMHRPGQWQTFNWVPMDPNAFRLVTIHTPGHIEY